MEYIAGGAGATLGFIVGDVPGMVAGGTAAYKYAKGAKNFTQKKSMTDSGYGTSGNKRRKTAGRYVRSPNMVTFSRKRKTAWGKLGGKDIGPLSRSAFLKRAGVGRVGTSKRQRTSRGKSFGGHSVGIYKGKFKKPRRIMKTKEQTALSKGFSTTIEQFGGTSDPNCVFITHSTVSHVQTAYTLATAIMRKLMTLAGFKITNKYNEVGVSDPADGVNQGDKSDGLTWFLQVKNPETNIVTAYKFLTLDNQSFSTWTDFSNALTSFADLPNRIIEFLRDTNKNVLYRVALYKTDESVSTHYRLASEIFLEDLHIEIHYASNLVIQNRTKSAVTGLDDYSIDRVDTQPLKGYVYEFKHGDPRVRHSFMGAVPSTINNNIFNVIPENGMNLIRGEQYLGASEPFVPKYFANISKATKVILQPGEMKKVGFNYTFKGKMINVLRKMNTNNTPLFDVTKVTGAVGKCQMIALEELMRTPSDNFINIAYERELKISAFCKVTHPQAPLETKVVAEQIQNFAP